MDSPKLRGIYGSGGMEYRGRCEDCVHCELIGSQSDPESGGQPVCNAECGDYMNFTSPKTIGSKGWQKCDQYEPI